MLFIKTAAFFKLHGTTTSNNAVKQYYGTENKKNRHKPYAQL